MNIIEVTCAIIVKGNEILAVQRSPIMPHPMKWEFPGGKTEPHENAEQCIIRELKEELSIQVEIMRRLPDVIHHYGHKTIRLVPFEVSATTGKITLHEHSAMCYFTPDKWDQLDWLEADIKVIQAYLDQRKS